MKLEGLPFGVGLICISLIISQFSLSIAPL